MQQTYPKNRWAWAEINLGALRQNVHTYKEGLERGVKLMAVIKADAYGHGAVRCAKEIIAAGADQLAVATVDEALELRRAGIDVPLLVLSEPPLESIQDLVEHDIMPAVTTEEFALAFGECAAHFDKKARYHLAIDTGMTRTGVSWQDALDFRRMLDFHSCLECAGTFTHFATADMPGDWDFSLQLQRFEDTIKLLRANGFDCGLIHCDNTAATVLAPKTHFDMCRVGLGLFGLHPTPLTRTQITLEPVMSVKARITRVVTPEVNTGVSYGMTYRTRRPGEQIATLPLGYADGYKRALSGRVQVLVHGKPYHQVGTICMDQCMIMAEPSMANAQAAPLAIGDVATLMGTDGETSVTADDLAQAAGTINYEIVCGFGMRLEKVYV